MKNLDMPLALHFFFDWESGYAKPVVKCVVIEKTEPCDIVGSFNRPLTWSTKPFNHDLELSGLALLGTDNFVYRDAVHINQGRILRMFGTLRKINQGMNKLSDTHGEADTFGQLAWYFATVIGAVGIFVVVAKGEPGNVVFELQLKTGSQAIDRINQLIDEESRRVDTAIFEAFGC